MDNYHILVWGDGILFAALMLFSILKLKALNNHHLFFLFFFISGAMQITSIITSHFDIKNAFVMPVYVLGQIVCLGGYYYGLLKNDKNALGLKLLFFVLLALFVLELFRQLSGGLDLSWYSHLFTSLTVAMASFIVMVVKSDLIKDRGSFLIHIGVFLYSSVSALIFLFGNILVEIPFAAQISIWLIHTLVHIVFLILIGRSLWMITRS